MHRARVPGLVVLMTLSAAPGAEAAPMSYGYGTFGSVFPAWWPGTGGGHIVGTPSVTFRGVETGRYAAPTTFPLGEFVVAAPGQPTTYQDAPFAIGFEIPELSRTISTPRPDEPYAFRSYVADLGIYGRLNGWVDADGKADLTLTVDRIEQYAPRGYPAILFEDSLPFALSDFHVGSTLRLATPPGGGALVMSATVVPEPAPLAILAAAGAAYGLRRRLKGRTA